MYSRADLPQRGFGWSPLESWRAGKYLYIRAPKPELYDLIADPPAAHNLAQSSKATLDTMAAQLDNFDHRLNGEAGKSSTELNSSEMQKLASLGYVGLQKSSSSATTVAGTDPKDKIATANTVIAAAARDQSKPDLAIARAIAALEPIVSADPNLYLAQYTLAADRDNPAGDFKTAIIHLEIATGRLPAFAPAHLSLAEAYEHTGRAADAKRQRDRTEK